MCLASASALQGLAEVHWHNVDTEVLTILKWLILSPLNTTMPLTPSLWHRRCRHHNLVDIAKMQKDALVTEMTFASSHKSDIVCEPCLAGKMHSNPFPSSPSCSTKPLELVHSDLHVPLPVATHEGYRYWITFLDDATSYQAAMRLKTKGQAL